MTIKRTTLWALLLAMQMPLSAQVITFEGDSLPHVGVWDAWKESPFRRGTLQGNCRVLANPLADEGNPSGHVLGCQRSLHGSNLYGARIDLPREMQFELTPEERYLHVGILKPLPGRCLLMVLGKHREADWRHQDDEVVQSSRLALNEAVPGRWTDVVFPMKGAGGIEARSLVIVFDCESPHRLTEPFAAYLDNIRLGDADPLLPGTADTPGMDALPTDAWQADTGTAQDSGTVLVTNSQRNGEVLLSNGQPFNAGYRHPRRTPLCVRGVPEQGFTCTGIIVHHGPGRALSRLFTQEDFQDDGSLIIPASLLTGDILIEGIMTERK